MRKKGGRRKVVVEKVRKAKTWEGGGLTMVLMEDGCIGKVLDVVLVVDLKDGLVIMVLDVELDVDLDMDMVVLIALMVLDRGLELWIGLDWIGLCFIPGVDGEEAVTWDMEHGASLTSWSPAGKE